MASSSRAIHAEQLASISTAMHAHEFPVEAILDCDETCGAFEAFLNRISEQENLIFIKALDDLRRLKHPANRRAHAARIMRQFFSLSGASASYELDYLPREVVGELMERWNSIEQQQSGAAGAILVASPTAAAAAQTSPKHPAKDCPCCPCCCSSSFALLFSEMSARVLARLREHCLPAFLKSKEFSSAFARLAETAGLEEALRMLVATPKKPSHATMGEPIVAVASTTTATVVAAAHQQGKQAGSCAPVLSSGKLPGIASASTSPVGAVAAVAGELLCRRSSSALIVTDSSSTSESGADRSTIEMGFEEEEEDEEEESDEESYADGGGSSSCSDVAAAAAAAVAVTVTGEAAADDGDEEEQNIVPTNPILASLSQDISISTGRLAAAAHAFGISLPFEKQQSLSEENKQYLKRKYVKHAETCISPDDVGRFHQKRALLFMSPLAKYDGALWTVSHQDSTSIMKLSKHYFRVAGSRRVQGWSSHFLIPFSLSRTLAVQYSMRGKASADGNIIRIEYRRYHSTTDAVRQRLDALMQRSDASPSDFDNAALFSGPITKEHFQMQWPFRTRIAVTFSAAIRDQSTDKVLVLRRSVREPAPGRDDSCCVALDYHGAQLFEPGPGNGYECCMVREYVACNFNLMIPGRALVQSIKKRAIEGQAKLVGALQDRLAHGTIDEEPVDDLLYRDIRRSMQENGEIIRMVEAAKRQYFEARSADGVGQERS